MNSSRVQYSTTASSQSSAEFSKSSAVRQQTEIPFQREPLPGSFDDSAIIRGVLIRAIKESGRSRAEICDEMELLLARPFTVRMLDGFTADSRSDRRWPAEFDRAFCKATGDNTLLACRAEMAGLHVISAEEMLLLDLGRQFLIRNQADEKIAILQKRLHGRIA